MCQVREREREREREDTTNMNIIINMIMLQCFARGCCIHGGMFIHIFFPFFSGGQVGGPCPLDDSWIYSDNNWSQLKSCSTPSHSSSFVPLNSQSSDVGILYGGSQAGPGTVSQVVMIMIINLLLLFMMIMCLFVCIIIIFI